MWYLLKNRPTEKRCGFKMASVKKVVKPKGTAKKWLWRSKILIPAIQVNFVLIPNEAGMSTNWPELLQLKFLPSTYTITAISCPPPLISQLLFTLAILNRAASFLQLVCFLSIAVINKKAATMSLIDIAVPADKCISAKEEGNIKTFKLSWRGYGRRKQQWSP